MIENVITKKELDVVVDGIYSDLNASVVSRVRLIEEKLLALEKHLGLVPKPDEADSNDVAEGEVVSGKE